MKPEYHVVSFSGGKDSTAMLLHMIELDYKIDEVINFDTGLEFPSMYDHIESVKAILDEHGIKFTVFKSPYTFEHFLLERERAGLDNIIRYGWGWPNIKNRWCTAYLKTRNSDAYIRQLSENFAVHQYLGIAMDESKRMERKIHKNGGFHYPLIEWGWEEKDCLDYCYKRGFDWNGLYEIFNRVSCWLCPLQSIGELYKLWENFPDLWKKLREWDDKLTELTGSGVNTFKIPYTVETLEKRFEVEKRRKSLNLSTKSPNFYREIDLKINGIPANQTKLEVW